MTKDGKLYVGIDAHSQEHTAVVANRWEEGKDFPTLEVGLSRNLWYLNQSRCFFGFPKSLAGDFGAILYP